jgi:protein-disulfide isomerase
MTTESQPPSPARTGPPASSAALPGRATPLWLMAVPLLCLVTTTVMWWQTRTELAAVRADQREVLDAIRGVSTIDVSGDHALGPDSAVVTLIEFSDYECPFCIRHFRGTMPEILANYIEKGRIRYVFKDFPIDQLHPEAIRGHEASRCAGEQGKFWEMHVNMWGPAGSHTPEAIEDHASAIGLSLPAFRECLASGRFASTIRESVDLAVRLGANGTPSFFVGLRDPRTDRVRIVDSVIGAQPFAAFEKAIAAAEAEARNAR